MNMPDVILESGHIETRAVDCLRGAQHGSDESLRLAAVLARLVGEVAAEVERLRGIVDELRAAHGRVET